MVVGASRERVVWWIGFVRVVVGGCGDTEKPAGGGTSGSASSSAGQRAGGGDGSSSTGGGGSSSGADGDAASGGTQPRGMAGSGAGTSSAGRAPSEGGSGDAGGGGEPAKTPYDGASVKPDTDTTPVASCAGQPDLKLCRVVTTPDRDYDICVGGECVSPGCGDTSCNSPAPHFTIPPNSKHEYLELRPGAEPVVIDLVTGLHWQACTAGATGEKCEGGQHLELSWEAAFQYCESSTWAGQTDWYLPDVWEIWSIVDWAQNGFQGAALNPALFPDGGRFPWTSTRFDTGRAIAPQLVYNAPFAATSLVKEAVSEEHAVRCVRRGFSRDAGYSTERFAVSVPASGRLVEDKSTGLIWQGCSSGATGPTCEGGTRSRIPIADFVSYCEGLSWGGFDDWRLPTYTELHSAVQYPPLSERTTDPSLPGKVFDLGASLGYLAGRSSLDESAKMLLISTRGGTLVGPTGDYPVACVRWK